MEQLLRSSRSDKHWRTNSAPFRTGSGGIYCINYPLGLEMPSKPPITMERPSKRLKSHIVLVPRTRLLQQRTMELLGAWLHRLLLPKDIPMVGPDIGPPGPTHKHTRAPSRSIASWMGAFSGWSFRMALMRSPSFQPSMPSALESSLLHCRLPFPMPAMIVMSITVNAEEFLGVASLPC